MPSRLLITASLLALAAVAHAQNTRDYLVVASVLETKKACDEAFPATSASTARAVESLRKKESKLYSEAEKSKDFPSMRKGASDALHGMPKAQLEQECQSLAESAK
jgi:hypothetical protein